MKLPAPLIIVLFSIAALAMSVYWQFSGGRLNIGGNNLQFPEFDKSVYLKNPYQKDPEAAKEPYVDFTSPDGNLTLKYPSAFSGGETLFGQETLAKLKLNNILLFAYQISIPDLQPSYILASETNGTTTEDIAEQIKQSLGRQQCAASVQNASSTNPAIFEIINAGYECADAMNGFNKWQSTAALVKKENGFYIIAAITTDKNWPNIQTAAQTLFGSISVRVPEQNATGTIATGTEETIKSKP